MAKSAPLTYIPKSFTNKAIASYLVGLALCSVLFLQYAMSLKFIIMGVVSVVGFFYYINQLSTHWHETKMTNKRFIRNLFLLAVILRAIYVVFSYFFYQIETGQPFMYDSADEQFYHFMANYGASLIYGGKFWFMQEFVKYSGGADASDLGYAIYLSYIYALTGKSVFLTRLIKAVLSAITAVLMYQLSRRNFGESMGRMVGIVCALAPNLIYYCGLQLKEAEMVFLTVLFIERADFVMRSRKLTAKDAIIVLLIGLALFTFRSVLGIVAFLSVGCAVMLSSERVMSWGKRLAIIAFALLVLGVGFGDRLMNQVNDLTAQAQGGAMQQQNMEWRSTREQGNSFAKYAGAAVFAPLIFTIPFPTVVDPGFQYNQQMLNGGNFVKNIMSFFAIFSLVMAIFTGDWRKYVLLWAFTMGYLAVIAMSTFAQSERFHQPAYPFIMMFACYGVSQMTKARYRQWYTYWCVAMCIAMIGWSWFKLKGRGMI